VVFKAQTADTYFISIASATGWTGQYSIRILPKFDEPSATWDASDDAEPNDIIELAYALGIGANQAQTHKIVDTTTYESDKLDQDFYQFNAQSGQTYVIETFDIPPTNFFRITGAQLLDATGTQLASDDLGQNGTGNVDARIVYRITTTGTYFILVNSPTGWIGQYSVRVCPDSCTRSVYLPFIRR
jgi:Bacterial pre-peptidase C-terminal domain